MAKQLYEKKEVLKLVGRLEVIAENQYDVTVEKANGEVETYDLNEILDALNGQVISLVSES